MPLSFADPAAASRPVHVVASDALADWLGGRTEAEGAWLAATGFEASLGELRLLITDCP